MTFKIKYNDLVKILEAFGEEDDSAKIIADYLDECIDYDMDLSFFLWNTRLFNVCCFDTKEEALEWIEDNLDCNGESVDCTLFDGECGVYLEY